MAAGSRRFPHDERMRHRWEFERVRKTGLIVRGHSMMLSLASSPDRRERRVGFIVTRHCGGAVKRNLVRRRMREIYRLNRCRLKRGIHLVLIARRPGEEASYHQMNEEFLSLYRTAVKRLCEKADHGNCYLADLGCPRLSTRSVPVPPAKLQVYPHLFEIHH